MEMKIGVAQIKPTKGEVHKNLGRHRKCILLAASVDADALFFPELSITAYEPELANALAIDQNDSCLEDLQQLSDIHEMTIGVGMPIKKNDEVLIGMSVFQPNQPRQVYSKQHLHPDEYPYFVPGNNQLILTINQHKFAPAICYESLLPKHAEKAFELEANVYVAAVAKPAKDIKKAIEYFPNVAKKYSMTILLSNSVGPCDNFQSGGKTSIWNNKGQLLGQLDDANEGILIIDTETNEITKKNLNY